MEWSGGRGREGVPATALMHCTQGKYYGTGGSQLVDGFCSYAAWFPNKSAAADALLLRTEVVCLAHKTTACETKISQPTAVFGSGG